MYLVDTDVISAGAPSKARVTGALVEWMDRNSQRLYLSAITIAEIESGIAKTRRQGAVRKAAALTQWLETLLHLYASRVLPFDVPAARIAGRLSDIARGTGRIAAFADMAIAAIGKANGLAILTRKTRHFASFSIATHDPFATLPP